MFGGAVSAGAGLTVKNFGITSNRLTGAGGLTVTNGYSSAGGAINLGGAVSITQAAGNLAINNPISAGTLTLASGANDVLITDAIVSSGSLTNVTGRDLKMLSIAGPATLQGASMNVNMTRDVIVTGSNSGAATLQSTGGAQTITAGRDITLAAGGAGPFNDAVVRSSGGFQTVSALGTVPLTGGPRAATTTSQVSKATPGRRSPPRASS